MGRQQSFTLRSVAPFAVNMYLYRHPVNFVNPVELLKWIPSTTEPLCVSLWIP